MLQLQTHVLTSQVSQKFIESQRDKYLDMRELLLKTARGDGAGWLQQCLRVCVCVCVYFHVHVFTGSASTLDSRINNSNPYLARFPSLIKESRFPSLIKESIPNVSRHRPQSVLTARLEGKGSSPLNEALLKMRVRYRDQGLKKTAPDISASNSPGKSLRLRV